MTVLVFSRALPHWCARAWTESFKKSWRRWNRWGPQVELRQPPKKGQGHRWHRWHQRPLVPGMFQQRHELADLRPMAAKRFLSETVNQVQVKTCWHKRMLFFGKSFFREDLLFATLTFSHSRATVRFARLCDCNAFPKRIRPLPRDLFECLRIFGTSYSPLFFLRTFGLFNRTSLFCWHFPCFSKRNGTDPCHPHRRQLCVAESPVSGRQNDQVWSPSFWSLGTGNRKNIGDFPVWQFLKYGRGRSTEISWSNIGRWFLRHICSKWSIQLLKSRGYS